MRSMILTFLVCVTLGGGCGGAQPQTAGGHGSDAARAPAESVVRLLDAGTGDKQTLRLQLTSGDRSTMTMKMGMSMVVAVDGQRRSAVTFPPMVSLLDWRSAR